jgi:hypothetical protein
MWDRALFWGPIASLLASLPAALRLSRSGVSFPEALAGHAALLCVPVVALMTAGAVARAAAAELEAQTRRRIAVGFSIWAVLCLVMDASVGAVLQSSTHHRPLGGVTFAAVALCVGVACALAAWRIEAIATSLFRRRGLLRGATVAASVAASVGVAVLAARAWSGFSDQTRCCAVDVAAVASLVVAGPWLPSRRNLWAAGLAGLAVVLLVGGMRVGSSGGLAAAMGARAPLAWSIGATVGIMH